MNTTKKESFLIVSYGPVPTPKYQKIEGGGQRCWGLAQGLRSKGYDVTVAVNQGFPVDVQENEGVFLTNWQEDDGFAQLLNMYDNVIVNYAMGGPMSFIVDHISDHTTLILDCYVPIYIEVSARNSEDTATEYRNYFTDLSHWNKALKRGDYFLCANEPQKHMYTGALGALGIINPFSYKQQRVLVVPFGVERAIEMPNKRNPYLDLGIKKSDNVLLWFGGLYPWFNIRPLLNTVKKIASNDPTFKFVIVGGKNPYNSHPDFVRQYEETVSFAKDRGLYGSTIHFVDWVDFAERYNWYHNAKAVISINNIGEENLYSWRTRVMDFVGGETPMITNGGDPLSDSLISAGAAIKITDTKESTLHEAILSIFDNPKALERTKTSLIEQKERYFWDVVIEPIAAVVSVRKEALPYLLEKQFRQDIGINSPIATSTGGNKYIRVAKKLFKAPRKVAGIVRRKGVKRSAALALHTIHNRGKKATHNSKRYYFFSHPIDYTGAPLVLIDILKDFCEHIDSTDIDIVYPGGEKDLLHSIKKLGIVMDKMAMGVGSRVIHAQLGIKKDDFVLLNTVAVYPNYRDYVLGLLDSNRLNEAVWFIHEDKPELRFGDDLGLIERVKRLIQTGKIKVFVPSIQTAKEYNEFFDTDLVQPITLRVETPAKYQKPRKASDFEKIHFILSGTSTDGRKGQMLAISALANFERRYASKNPSQYRDYKLSLIAVGKDDYISSQVRSIGNGLLGDKVEFFPTIPKAKAMEITYGGNVTVCCSLNETFGLFVAEGMQMGHILIRNYASGYQEQITNRKNGHLVDTMSLDDFTDAIEKVLNKSNSDEKLLAMSKESQKIAKKFLDSNYYTQITS